MSKYNSGDERNLRPIIFAVLVHAALIGLLLVGLDWTPKVQPQMAGQPEAVQANVVDEAKLQAEMRRKKEEDQRKKRQEQERQKKLEDQAKQAQQTREQEEKRLAQLEEQRKQQQEQTAKQQQEEAARLEKIKQEQQAETEHLEKLKQEKQAMEQKRQEEEKRLQEIKAKQAAEEQRAAEQKRQEEKRLAEEQTKRKIEEEQKRKADEEKQRRDAEQQLKEQLEAEEQAAQAAARAQQVKSLLAQYAASIQQRVTRSWLKPPSIRPGMTCTVRVKLAPGGQVVDAKVVVSSGDAVFDRSVEGAVYKASPLPWPTDQGVLEFLDRENREIEFTFKPT